MSESRILELLARKMAKEATEAELSELQYLLKQFPDGVYYEELFNQLWAQPQATDNEAAYLLHTLKHPEITKEDEVSVKGTTSGKRWLAYATAFLVLVISGVFLFYKYQNVLDQGLTEIYAGKGIRKKVLLPDGTQVWLNCNSKLSFANNLRTGTTRNVMLEGEAFFDVTKNKHRPFVISTKKFSIRVLGTAFNVKAYADEKYTEAALIRGIIELTVAGSDKQKILLKPNEKFTLTEKRHGSAFDADDAGSRSLSIKTIKPIEIQSQKFIEETSWVDNKLVFQNETFGELVPKLERWYNVSINIKNKAVGEYHYTGIFQNETLDQALKAMQLIKPFNYEIKNDEVTVN